MKKFTKRIAALSLAAVMAISFTGCQKSGDASSDANANVAEDGEAIDTETKEIRQNDYRGGIKRTLALQEKVLKVMEDMKANNTVIRQDSPNSFWTADGYQDFVSTFLDTEIINDTQWFNEEETDWDTLVAKMSSVPNNFTVAGDEGYSLDGSIVVLRNEKDDYSVNNVPCTLYVQIEDKYTEYPSKANYRILYDCDKDWCKAYATMRLEDKLPAVTAEMFEYQRVNDDTFIIQTSRERLMVVLAPAEKDTDIRNREVKEFYYSKLVIEGQRTTYEPYELLPEAETLEQETRSQNASLNELYTKDYPFLNQDGDLCSRYGENDSMFFYSPKDITNKWVFEDKALQQGIAYKDGVLVVTTYNKLSKNYERFVYAKADATDKTIKELEGLAEIKNLVGIQEAETATAPDEVPEPTGSTEETQEATEKPFGESEPETPDTTEAEPNESSSDSGAESEISG